MSPPPADSTQASEPSRRSNGDATSTEPFELFSSLRYDPALLKSSANTALSGRPNQPSPFYMLRYHRDRIMAAAEHFGWEKAATRLAGEEGLERLSTYLEGEVTRGQPSPDEGGEGSALRLRTLLSKAGDLRVEMAPVPPVPLDSLYPSSLPAPSPPPSHQDAAAKVSSPATPFRIHIDAHSTPATPFTHFKTTSRDMYSSARSRAGIPDMASPEEVILVNPRGELMEGSLTSVYLYRDGAWVTPPVEVDSGGQAGTTRRWLLEKGFVTEGKVSRESVKVGEWVWVSNGVKGLVGGRVV
ncbi:MAG: hypothetical protein M4579_001783 [Chaenotheca gracillima]|nr:MAG: hypothetical protein M4579_001783 [Chaenotheca gracillima]